MRRYSAKRQKQNKIYEKVREEKRRELIQSGMYFCVFCLKKQGMHLESDCHHLIGRDDDDLIQKRYLSFAHRECHTTFHSKAPKDIWWYELYLKNLKNQWPELI